MSSRSFLFLKKRTFWAFYYVNLEFRAANIILSKINQLKSTISSLMSYMTFFTLLTRSEVLTSFCDYQKRLKLRKRS